MSLETANSLLDLLCFYGDREPVQPINSVDSGESEEQVSTAEMGTVLLIRLERNLSRGPGYFKN